LAHISLKLSRGSVMGCLPYLGITVRRSAARGNAYDVV
jgi:hypothetical protein